ncbi:MAG: 1-acyl-sn-glycerol-3-phosphate acyltransferase, partial [Bacteroides sp.]|nr:1-acyl-sn-glycerol-3-phosphate acyltransferase [Bacteroides sp.]
MRNFFVRLYDWFFRRKALLYVLLAVWIIAMGVLALRMRFVEDITSFFSDDEKGKRQSLVFENLKITDRIVILVEGEDRDDMIDAGDRLLEVLEPLVEEGYLARITSGLDASSIERGMAFIYGYLPIFLDTADYVRFDSLLDKSSVEVAVRRCFDIVASPSGAFMGRNCLRDPLGMGLPLLSGLERFGRQTDYDIYAEHIFSKDGSVMFLFADPVNGMGSTGENDAFVSRFEQMLAQVRQETGMEINYLGGSAIAVYNARQIKKDTMFTFTLALLVIVLVISLSLRNRAAVFQIILPAVFGALFALGVLSLLQGQISAIAMGAGAAIFGIALSYSIHFVSHHTHADNPRQVVAELAYPLTVGSFTTVGAFVALLFTHSRLLQDFGAFASLALVGTTVFCLVFLPHFLSAKKKGATGKLLSFIDKANAYPYEQNRWLVGGILVLLAVCAFYSDNVLFDSDLHHLNYEPPHLRDTERKLTELTENGGEKSSVFLVSFASTAAQTQEACRKLDSCLQTLEKSGKILSFSTVDGYFIDAGTQKKRIDCWNEYWRTRRLPLIENIDRAAVGVGFSEQAFDAFKNLLGKEYTVCDYSAEVLVDVPLFSDFINASDSSFLLVARMELRTEEKSSVYETIENCPDTSIIDRGYYSNRMLEDINNDFYFILFISSLLVSVALLLSYGRIELTLLSLLPMFASWLIILGFMAWFDIPFNIVNIILSTFIFGIGDDFSIFIMDGLLSEYREGKKLFNAHKTAIFFSAFTTIVGLGALIFARHPAVKSIAVISVLGLSVVIVVSYTLQPFLFHRLVSLPVQRGGFPYTLRDLARTFYAFVYFFLGCLLAQFLILLSLIVPLPRDRKQYALHVFICGFMRIFLRTIPSTHVERLNPGKETFGKPAVIIANHQSFIDILLMMALTPRLVLVTNGWVWKSPVLGPIVRYLGCFYTGNGYEHVVEQLRGKVEQGYSIMVFPEGTRSEDGAIARFHKGAFLIAEGLRLDIVPVLIYGAGMVSSKRQAFYIKPGRVVSQVEARVPYGDLTFGTTYREQAKAWSVWFRTKYGELCERYDRAGNPYFRNALRRNYLYKGAWLLFRLKREFRAEAYYDALDWIVPRDAVITEMGCGVGSRGLMLGMLSRRRRVLGMDTDSEKVRLANHGFMNRENVSFALFSKNPEDWPLSDVFLVRGMSGMEMRAILQFCLLRLRANGMLVLDG